MKEYRKVMQCGLNLLITFNFWVTVDIDQNYLARDIGGIYHFNSFHGHYNVFWSGISGHISTNSALFVRKVRQLGNLRISRKFVKICIQFYFYDKMWISPTIDRQNLYLFDSTSTQIIRMLQICYKIKRPKFFHIHL